MAILNYTTKIPVNRTVNEIQNLLARAGAKSVIVHYDTTGSYKAAAIPVAVEFQIKIGNEPVLFRLPSRWHGVFNELKDDATVPKRLKTEEQAQRVAWRIVKDWTEAQIAIVAAGLAELPEVFLPYAIDANTDKTLYDTFAAQKTLPPPE